MMDKRRGQYVVVIRKDDTTNFLQMDAYVYHLGILLSFRTARESRLTLVCGSC